MLPLTITNSSLTADRLRRGLINGVWRVGVGFPTPSEGAEGSVVDSIFESRAAVGVTALSLILVEVSFCFLPPFLLHMPHPDKCDEGEKKVHTFLPFTAARIVEEGAHIVREAVLRVSVAQRGSAAAGTTSAVARIAEGAAHDFVSKRPIFFFLSSLAENTRFGEGTVGIRLTLPCRLDWFQSYSPQRP